MRKACIVFLSLALVPGCVVADAPARQVQTRKVTQRYVGDIHGAKADAVVTYEKVRDYVIAAGEIDSNGYKYTFTADLYGESGYGSMVSHADNTRFQIKMQITKKGFALTSNPLGPGTPTTYYFTAV